MVYLADPQLITDHTQFVQINGHRLRIVHIIHELGSKVPLLVFIHGLGAQVCHYFLSMEYPTLKSNTVLSRLLNGSTKSNTSQCMVTSWPSIYLDAAKAKRTKGSKNLEDINAAARLKN